MTEALDEESIIKLFEVEMEGFDEAVNQAVKISESRIGVDHTGRQNIALFIFAKLISHCMSMQLILDKYQVDRSGSCLLDHFSLASLGRVALDASVMVMYISDGSINREQWDLRRQVFRLHELCNRRRFLVAISGGQTGGVPFFQTYRIRKHELCGRITRLAGSLGYSKDKIDVFLKGQTVYIDGLRGAVREAGWDLGRFEFQQSYLSNWVHSHPVSFLRFAEQEISFSRPSDYQISVCCHVLEMVTRCLVSANVRMTEFTGSKALDSIGHLD